MIYTKRHDYMPRPADFVIQAELSAEVVVVIPFTT